MRAVELRRVGVRQRIVVGPGIDPPVNHGALVGRDVALRQEHDHVEGGIARPGTAHAVVEVEPVHLRPHQMPVDLFRDRPALGGEGVQAQPPLREFGVLARHRRGGVVRDAVDELGHLEGAPLLEELDQIRVRAGARGHDGLAGIRRAPHEEESDHDERDPGDEDGGTRFAAGHDGLPELAVQSMSRLLACSVYSMCGLLDMRRAHGLLRSRPPAVRSRPRPAPGPAPRAPPRRAARGRFPPGRRSDGCRARGGG